MQRTVLILAYFFLCAYSFAQQYPFVHYTPKEGLISNMIKGIYQDSKGRLYFSSVHGLSIYDGSRFINYNSKNGLGFDIVNQVIEMAPDSLWIITNSIKMNCIVNGKLKLLPFHNENHIINNLCKDEKGDIYAAAEDGLLIFDKKDSFIKLPFVDSKGEDVSSYIAYTFPFGDYLFVQRDASLLPHQDNVLYLYKKATRKIVSETPDIHGIQMAPDGRVWVSTENAIMAIDTTEIKKGKIVLQELPEQYAQLRNKSRYFILFDKSNNCWSGDQGSVLLKTTPDGTTTAFTSISGLNMFYINSVFQDREGITWIATNNDGVSKLVHNNFSHIEKPFDLLQPNLISYNKNSDNLLVYSSSSATATIIHNNKKESFSLNDPRGLTELIETPCGFFGTKSNVIYKLEPVHNVLHAKMEFPSDSDNFYSHQIIDKNGNLIATGKNYITAIINGKKVFKTKLPYYADFPAMDSKGNIWVATRANDLFVFNTHPDDPSNYLEQKLYFKKELSGISPRSIIIDNNDDIWIGTRNHGINVFQIKDEKLIKKLTLTVASGLSDDFTTHLVCDEQNNIWASSALGLDKISVKNGIPVIENITKQNNIFQSVFNVVIDKDNIAWGLVSNGIIKITPENKHASNYLPTLMVSMLKAGKDTVQDGGYLSYRQNNLSFNFAATSFFNEKQVLYSYRLNGGSNDQWSEPSNNASVSFINLQPGNYNLEIKATFPAGRYPDQTINYPFSISPAWWQTWWFRSITFLAIASFLVWAFRFYYRRKLEQKLAAFEKQQAIEKERTRIATDMHDDLGAGLSRIKFLSETIGIKKQQHQPIEEDVNKIREYSHEMIDKMGEIVWALNEKNDSLSDLLSYTRAYTMEYLSQNGIECKTEMPNSFPSVFVSGEFRRNVFLTIKEALHNVVKHSQATEVKLSISINHHLSIELKDNGTGIDKNYIRLFSNWLNNMESRVKEMGGIFEITNRQGTLIHLEIPLKA
ncbi:MAG TPA: ATP-binding protein [Chitinophagaceae bacterium]